MTTYNNSDIAVAGGDVIFAADLNDVVNRIPRTYTKVTATSRNTTTTSTDDPDLASIPLEVGTYEIELVGAWSEATTATQKIKTKWAFTGTWNGGTTRRNCIGAGQAQTTAPTGVTEVNLQVVSLTSDVVYDTAAGTGSGYTNFRELAGEVIVTVAGNLSVQWAQSASSANNTTLQEGSYFRVRRLV